MTPGKIIDQHTQFNKSLDEARHKIDLATTAGKNLDNILTPLYKRYGFLDDRMHLVDMDAHKIPIKQRPFTNDGKLMTSEEVLEMLGIDLKWYHSAVKNQNGIESKHRHELVSLTNLYIKAKNAMQGVIKKLGFECYNSGNLAFDVFSGLHWVTDFSKALEKVKHESGEYHLMHEQQIVEALQKRIYHRPKKVISNLNKTAAEFNTDIYTVKGIFEKAVGVTPREYSKMILNEALGDFLHHQGAQLANKVASKYGVGMGKVAAKSKYGARNDMNNVLTKWTEITQGNESAATPQALKAFLVGQLAMDPSIVDGVIKQYRQTFKQTPQDLAKARKMSAATKPQNNFEKTLASIDPNAPSDEETVGESVKQVAESYLPSNKLRSFFLDALNAQRQSVLKTPKKPAAEEPVGSQVSNAAGSQVSAAPKKPIGVTGVNKGGAAPVVPAATSAPQAPAKPAAKPTSIDFKAAIAALPPAERAAAITQSLGELTDDEIKQVLTTLTTRKK